MLAGWGREGKGSQCHLPPHTNHPLLLPATPKPIPCPKHYAGRHAEPGGVAPARKRGSSRDGFYPHSGAGAGAGRVGGVGHRDRAPPHTVTQVRGGAGMGAVPQGVWLGDGPMGLWNTGWAQRGMGFVHHICLLHTRHPACSFHTQLSSVTAGLDERSRELADLTEYYDSMLQASTGSRSGSLYNETCVGLGLSLAWPGLGTATWYRRPRRPAPRKACRAGSGI